MLVRIFILLSLLAPLSRGAANLILSQSGQFAIYGARSRGAVDSVPAGSVAVEPELLAISAERIRNALAVAAPAIASQGRQINLEILPEPTPGDVVAILATHFTDGWQYRVGIPPVVDETRLAKAIIQSLLVEYAQRTGERGVELPAWVVEGVAQELFYSVGPKLVVDRNSTGWQGSIRDLNGRTRETLRTNSPPTFNDLTTLAPPPAGAPAEALYQSSAHLLVHSLLQTPNGPQKLARFLQMLAQTWNWQTAFRQAFGFQTMLEVEKWWALVTVEFTSRDLRQAWSPAVSMQKLEELLATRVEFRAQTNSLPQARLIDLKTTLRELDWPYQRAALAEKVGQLGVTAPHLAPQVAVMALQYKKLLETYVEKRDRGEIRPGLPMTPAAAQQKLVDDTIRQIGELDGKRKGAQGPTVTAK